MKAIVTKANGADSIIMVSKSNSEQAAIMLRSETLSANEQGFLQTEKRVGWIKGKTEEIQKLASILKEGDDFNVKCALLGMGAVKLVIKEATAPFYQGQTPKINPTTGEVVMHGGSPVYRQTLVVSQSSSDVDSKLITDKVTVVSETIKEHSTEFTSAI